MGLPGGGEILVILLVALIVLGPQKLPDAARQLGRVVGEFRRMSAGFQSELRDAMHQDDDADARARGAAIAATRPPAAPAGQPTGPDAATAPTHGEPPPQPAGDR
jgi:sec-independent protein translocase protein TatB